MSKGLSLSRLELLGELLEFSSILLYQFDKFIYFAIFGLKVSRRLQNFAKFFSISVIRWLNFSDHVAGSVCDVCRIGHWSTFIQTILFLTSEIIHIYYLDLNMYFLSYMLHILRYLVSRFAEGCRILQYCSISVCKIFCFYLSTHYSCFISQASTKYSVTEFHVISKNLPCSVWHFNTECLKCIPTSKCQEVCIYLNESF